MDCSKYLFKYCPLTYAVVAIGLLKSTYLQEPTWRNDVKCKVAKKEGIGKTDDNKYMYTKLQCRIGDKGTDKFFDRDNIKLVYTQSIDIEQVLLERMVGLENTMAFFLF